MQCNKGCWSNTFFSLDINRHLARRCGAANAKMWNSTNNMGRIRRIAHMHLGYSSLPIGPIPNIRPGIAILNKVHKVLEGVIP